MIAVIQRVTEASVTIENHRKAEIGKGLLVLVSFEASDTQEDIDWLSTKIVQLRIFNDSEQVMNLSVKNVQGEILVVSQFTLHASTRKGNRPSYIKAATPEVANPLYLRFIMALESDLEKPVQTGVFGADMKVKLLNDGPVTIIIDTKNRV